MGETSKYTIFDRDCLKLLPLAERIHDLAMLDCPDHRVVAL